MAEPGGSSESTDGVSSFHSNGYLTDEEMDVNGSDYSNELEMDELGSDYSNVQLDELNGPVDDIELDESTESINVIETEFGSDEKYQTSDSDCAQTDTELNIYPTYISHVVYLDKSTLSCLNDAVENKPYIDIDKWGINEVSCIDYDFVKYEFYAQKMDSDSSQSVYSEDDEEEYLYTDLKNIQDGCIINDTVFLEYVNWHTITKIEKEIFKFCTLCDLVLDESWKNHVLTDMHHKRIVKYKPLKKYGLNVVRKINRTYHCGVCNDMFIDDEKHFSSKDHDGNLIEAIIKAEDLVDTNSCSDYGDNENKINNNNNIYNDGCKPDNDGNTLPNNGNIPTNDDGIQTNDTTKKSISYASMARTPKIVETESVNVTVGNTIFKVKHDSWHMVCTVKKKFHCMACNTDEHIILKRSHCREKDHLDNLKRCVIMEQFKNHLVRQVNETVYHCAHCNNIRHKHDMNGHLKSFHHKHNNNKPSSCETTNIPMKKAKTTKKVTNKPTNTIQHNDTAKESQENIPINDEHNIPINDDDNDKIVDDFTNMQVDVNIFGYIFRVPLESFHILTKRPFDFFCGLCHIALCDNNIFVHVNTIQHIQLMQGSPFLVQFGCNLIRPVRDFLHCAICNVSVPYHMIFMHIREVIHIENMTKATKTVPIYQHWQHITNPNQTLFHPRAPQMYTNRPLIPMIPMATSYRAANTVRKPASTVKNVKNTIVKDTKSYAHAITKQSATVKQNETVAEPIDTVAEPIDTVAEPIDTVTEPIVTVTEPIDIVTEPIDTVAEPIDTVAQPIDTVAEPIDTVAEPIDTVAQPIDTVAEPIDTVAEPIDTVAQPIDTVAQPIDTVAEPIDTVAEPIDTVAQPIDTVAEPIDTVAEPIDTVAQPIDTVAPLITTVAQPIDTEAQPIDTEAQPIDTVTEQNDTVTEENEIDTVAEQNDTLAELNVTLESSDSNMENLNISSELDESIQIYDTEEYIYLKLKNLHFRVTNSAYNSLVPIEGGRFCFVCDVKLEVKELLVHVDSRKHIENIYKCNFIDKYEKHLLRQMYLLYQCAICNVLFTKKFLQTHLEWPLHIEQLSLSLNSKKFRKKELASGKPERTIKTQRELIILKGTEPTSKVILHVMVVPDNLRLNKVIKFNDHIFKITFEHWHSLVGENVDYKCLMCKEDVPDHDLNAHIAKEVHTSKLENFEKFFLPALIRQINTNAANCVVCNTEVPNGRQSVETHISGKKHMRNYEVIVKKTAENLENCDEAVVTLIK